MGQNILSNTEKLLTGTRIPAMVNVILVCLLAFFAAKLTWQLWPLDVTSSAPPPNRGPSQAQAGANPVQLASAVANYHLFGDPAKPKTESKPSTEDAPDTPLNLSLKGVLAYDPQEGAMAIISQGSGDEKVYRVGDDVPGNAKLAEVYPDRVILERGGRYETLRLPENSVPINSKRAAANNRDDDDDDGIAQDLVGISAKELRDRVQKNPTAFFRKVSYVPVKEAGKQIGIKLRARGNEDVLAQFGVQPDDVIVEVNGTRLDDMKKGRRLLRTLSTADSIEATVLRNGVEIPLFISLAE